MKDKTIVSKVAFLIGINYKTLTDKFYGLTATVLYQNSDANLINRLCSMRTFLMANYFESDFKVWEESRFTGFVLALNKLGIKVDTTLKSNYEYYYFINDLINKNLNKCADVFENDDVDWSRIMNFLIFPQTNNQRVAESEIKYFNEHRELYPFGCYVNFKHNRPGNILSYDELFLNIIGAKPNQKVHTTFHYIDSFLETNDGANVLVDCENSDPFKFFEYLNSLKTESKNRLKCVYLISDSMASTAWRYLPEYFKSIDFRFSEIARIKSSKSLVDENLMFVISRLHFEEREKSFVICSSDSDFLALVDLFPEAELFFVCDKFKTSNRTINYLKNENVCYEFLKTTGSKELENFEFGVMKSEFKDYLEAHFGANYFEILSNIMFDAHLLLSDDEKKKMINCFVDSTKIFVDENNKLCFSIDAKMNF